MKTQDILKKSLSKAPFDWDLLADEIEENFPTRAAAETAVAYCLENANTEPDEFIHALADISGIEPETIAWYVSEEMRSAETEKLVRDELERFRAEYPQAFANVNI